MAPFRDALADEVMTSPTRAGTLSLEVAPRHVTVALADVQLAIAEGVLTITRAARRRARRGLPSEGVGIWLESRPDQVERVFGAEPRDLITSADGLTALRQLDRLVRRMTAALAALGGGVRQALEIGPAGDRGLDKVLFLDFGDHVSLYRRSLFHPRAVRVLDAHESGLVVIPTRSGEVRITCRSRFGCSVIGDYVRFTTPAGDDLASVSLPWVSRGDRDEIARRLGEIFERGRGADVDRDPTT
ncbi:MAG: hypothetical protein HS111_24630 [Kofleriaceae bacterium]|nr:hypothetical protein [Kofleriaceae bacterium]MCL4225354.1 hypothetical protein [Myxococcales bacterium]